MTPVDREMGCEESTEASEPEQRYGWPGLTPEDEKEIKQKWGVFDKDGNGKVDVKELEEVMRAMGANVDKGDAARMIEEADHGEAGNANRKMEFEEFHSLMSEKQKAAWEKEQKNRNARASSGRLPERSHRIGGGHWEN